MRLLFGQFLTEEFLMLVRLLLGMSLLFATICSVQAQNVVYKKEFGFWTLVCIDKKAAQSCTVAAYTAGPEDNAPWLKVAAFYLPDRILAFLFVTPADAKIGNLGLSTSGGMKGILYIKSCNEERCAAPWMLRGRERVAFFKSEKFFVQYQLDKENGIGFELPVDELRFALSALKKIK
jgi:invasion protein IalB